MEQFNNTPQAGETDNTDDCGENDVGDEKRQPEKNYTRSQEYRPASVRKVILALDYDGMEDPDTQKRR